MKKIAVFTSGGDAPGMNACIRAVVRSGIHKGLEVYGIYRGYEGLINGEIERLHSEDVSNIIQRGGTILGCARSAGFFTKEGRQKAFDHLKANGIEGVVAIGGDGTFTGASIFSEEFPVNFIGVPGTIDNDLFGTDYTIGYDTALNTVVDVVDKIRDTAASHERLFFVEVMGKDAGFIALRSGISVGAEAVLIPETETYVDHLVEKLQGGLRSNKRSSIVLVAEGDDGGGAFAIAEQVKKQLSHFDVRVSVLGHMQRGGSPSAMDRVLASELGLGAVNALVQGKRNEMVGKVNMKLTYTPFEKAAKHNKTINKHLLELAEILST